MEYPSLTISQEAMDFESVWVRVQTPRHSDTVPYSIAVTYDYVGELFDATDKAEAESWNDYLLNEVAELGSAMLSL